MKEISFEDAVAQTTEMLAKASTWLVKHYPYIATALYGLIPEPVVGIGTMGVTKGLVLYYDPIWILNDADICTPKGYEVLGTDLYHEVNHVMRDLDRVEELVNIGVQKSLERPSATKLANIAADIPINDDIDKDPKLRLQSWACRSTTFGFPDGKTMEQYMQLLIKDLKKKEAQTKPKTGDDKEGEGGESGGDANQPCSGGCGGIAGNEKHRKLEEELDKKFGRSEAECEDIKRTTYAEIEEYQRQRGRGSTPGFHLEDIAFKKTPSKIDWKREMSYIIRRVTGNVIAGGDDYSMRRPAKRSALLGVLRPGLIDQLPTIAFIRDTSGSMRAEDLNVANNEAINVMKRLGLDQVWFLDADTEVHGKPKLVRIREIPQLKAKGRGGTDFIKPLNAVHKMRPRPDVCIYLTDGEGPAPAKEPAGMKVVWCIVPQHHGCIPATWGHAVICSEDPSVVRRYSNE